MALKIYHNGELTDWRPGEVMTSSGDLRGTVSFLRKKGMEAEAERLSTLKEGVHKEGESNFDLAVFAAYSRGSRLKATYDPDPQQQDRVSLERVFTLAAKESKPKATPESCEAEDKFYRSGPGEPHCVSKPGQAKEEEEKIEEEKEAPIEESGVFSLEEAEDILGLAEDEPRQYDPDDDPFASEEEFPEVPEWTPANAAYLDTVQEVQEELVKADQARKKLDKKLKELRKKPGSEKQVASLELEKDRITEHFKELQDKKKRLKATGKKELEAIHEVGEELYSPKDDPRFSDEQKSKIDKFGKWLNQRGGPIFDFIERALELGGLHGPGIIGKLLGVAVKVSSWVLKVPEQPFTSIFGEEAKKWVDGQVRKAMPLATQQLAMARAGEVAKKRAEDQIKKADAEAKELFKKIEKAKPDIAKVINEASIQGTEESLDNAMVSIEKWSEVAQTAEEAQQALDAKEVVSMLQRVKRLRSVIESPETYIPPRVKKALMRNPEQYLRDDRGMTTKLLVQAVGKSITKALGG